MEYVQDKILKLSARATEYFSKKYNLDDNACVVVCTTYVSSESHVKSMDDIRGAQAWFAAFGQRGTLNTDWNDKLMNNLEEGYDLDMCLDMLTEYLDSLEVIDGLRIIEGSEISESIGYGD